MQPLFNRTGSFFKRMFQGTLPDNGYPPVESLECIHVSSITLDISLKLLCPEVSICMWHGRISAAFMTMPETAMNEYHSLVLGEHHVRGTRKFSDMEPIPESSGEKSGAKSSFRPSVLSSDARHHAAALRSGRNAHGREYLPPECLQKWQLRASAWQCERMKTTPEAAIRSLPCT